MKFVVTLAEHDARMYVGEVSKENEINRCNMYPACDELKCPSKRTCPFYFFVKNPEFLARAFEHYKDVQGDRSKAEGVVVDLGHIGAKKCAICGHRFEEGEAKYDVEMIGCVCWECYEQLQERDA